MRKENGKKIERKGKKMERDERKERKWKVN